MSSRSDIAPDMPDRVLRAVPVNCSDRGPCGARLGLQDHADGVRLPQQAPGSGGFDHRAIASPVTFLVGEKDRSLGYVRTWASELPQGRFVLVPGGHMNVYAGAVARRACELLRGQP
jgi:pimeloyl-ACP methyl ester carboxylesterase